MLVRKEEEEHLLKVTQLVLEESCGLGTVTNSCHVQWTVKTSWLQTIQMTVKIMVYMSVCVSVCVLSQSSSRRIQQAFERHCRMCRVLLSAYESLQSSFESLIIHLPSSKRIDLGTLTAADSSDQLGWIVRTSLKSPLSWVPLNSVEISVADFATQHLSGLVLIDCAFYIVATIFTLSVFKLAGLMKWCVVCLQNTLIAMHAMKKWSPNVRCSLSFMHFIVSCWFARCACFVLLPQWRKEVVKLNALDYHCRTSQYVLASEWWIVPQMSISIVIMTLVSYLHRMYCTYTTYTYTLFTRC